MSGQTWIERYGDEKMESDAPDECPHANAQLMFVHPSLDEWYCFDCQRKVRVWNGV